METKTFGREVARLRKAAGMSPKQLAQQVENKVGGSITVQTVNDLEHDNSKPSPWIIIQIADVLGLEGDARREFKALPTGPFPTALSQEIVRLMDEKALTVSAFRGAVLKGGRRLATQYINNLRSGRRTPSPEVRDQIAALLGVEPWYLATLAGEMPQGLTRYLKENPETAPTIDEILHRALDEDYTAWESLVVPHGDLSPTPHTRFGSYLAEVRMRSGLTRNEIAAKAGLSKGYMCEIENGPKIPTPQAIATIAPHVKVSALTLLAAAGWPLPGAIAYLAKHPRTAKALGDFFTEAADKGFGKWDDSFARQAA